jgi:acyl CoA:acetate/3-ketoacid CoA transferase beta subunit
MSGEYSDADVQAAEAHAGVGQATRAEVCVAACADAWRGDGEIIASPMGLTPSLGARLARLTFEPDLLLSDGESLFLSNIAGPGSGEEQVFEGYIPYRLVFDLLAHGKRHVMMGASQIDRFGNQNISAVGGDWNRPKAQLIGVRGAPGNTVNHPTSYWIAKHTPKVFVEKVDLVSGIGYDRAARVGGAARFHEIRRVVTNLAVLDFQTPDHRMRLRSVHPGVSVDDVVEATGFELAGLDTVETTRVPSDEELRLIRDVLDPRRTREREVGN